MPPIHPFLRIGEGSMVSVELAQKVRSDLYLVSAFISLYASVWYLPFNFGWTGWMAEVRIGMNGREIRVNAFPGYRSVWETSSDSFQS